jgi:hypothetical protein
MEQHSELQRNYLIDTELIPTLIRKHLGQGKNVSVVVMIPLKL